ncbi:MAG: FtsK/SpoIIIE domain-containing protein, partial [Ktedonobacterales bacterium]
TPHLVLVVDALNLEGATEDPTANPLIQLALRRGKELGATVLSLHGALVSAPAGCTLAVDVSERQVIPLWPSPPEATRCDTLDTIGPAECLNIGYVIALYQPRRDEEQTLPKSVRLLSLFTPPIPSPVNYDVEAVWERSRQHAQQARVRGERSFAIPIGTTASDQSLSLDFVSDGPHGLLIGQTGSGKSELLRSIVAALAMTYPPDMVNFILVDYKGGLGLEVFEHLPHTLSLLTNLERAGQTTRFLTMLESEMLDRQEKLKQGLSLPRLFVIIDEFAEMVARRGANDASDAILENLLRIVRLGRQLDVHLLFASQRPEGSVIAKLRGYVQYRLCLRTNTEDDSKDILGRPDAAYLSIDTPGRGYVLRGDNALTLFQAALVSVPVGVRSADSTEEPRGADDVIAERLSKTRSAYTVVRWPESLPAPTTRFPTPLILAAVGKYPPAALAWPIKPRPELKMVAPIGLYDRPNQRTRDWFLVDLLGHAGRLQGGSLLVMGDL